MNGSPMSTGDVPSTIHEMRASDRSAGRRPALSRANQANEVKS